LTGKPVIVPYGNHSRFIAHLDDATSRRAVYFRLPDFAEMRAWQRTLRPGDLFVDIGANAGLYTILALDLGASVISVEPGPVVDQLRANLVENGYDAEVIEAALADTPGRTRLHGPDSNRAAIDPAAMLEELASPSASTEGWVEVTTLDAVLGERTATGVKIDVEGAERLVLEGAERALAEHRIGLLQLEWNRAARALLDEDRMPVARLLGQHGYELLRPRPDGELELVEPEELAPGTFGPDVFARPRA